MALVKTCMKLTPLLLRNNIKLCVRAKHKETRTDLYLWRASPKVPTTPEEIEAAAEKYNLHPTEYKSYRQDDCYGDYPKLPYIGTEARDGYYPWDFPALRRNFGEPLHLVADQIGEDRYSAGVRQMMTQTDAWLMTIGTFIVSGIIYYICDINYWYQPAMEKQYPKPGVTHYTFEPLD